MPIEIEGNIVNMEVDTGSGVAMAPLQFYENYLKHILLLPGDKSFKTFTGQMVKASGKVFMLMFSYGNYKGKLRLYTVNCTGYCLLGREWLREIPFNWKALFSQKYSPKPDRALKVSAVLFEEGLRKISGAKAKIVLRDEAQPIMLKPHRVPYALKAQVEAELDRLEKSGVLTLVSHSEWGTGIVAVPKKDGSGGSVEIIKIP